MATEKPEDQTGNNDGTVTFDEKQQERVNQIVKERLARQEAALKKTFDDQMTSVKEQFQTQLDELKTTKIDDKGVKKGGDHKDAEAEIRAAVESQFKGLLDAEKQKVELAKAQAEKLKSEKDAAVSESYRIRKEVEMRRAASDAANFYNIDDVLALTDKQIDFDADSGQWVVKENGIVKQNSELKPMSLKEFYEQWAQARPHFVNGDVKGGAGSVESKGGAPTGMVTKRSDLKGAEAISDYITKFGFDAYEKLKP